MKNILPTKLTAVPIAKQHPELFKDGLRHTTEQGNHTYHLTQAQIDVLGRQNDQLKSDLYKVLNFRISQPAYGRGGCVVSNHPDRRNDS